MNRKNLVPEKLTTEELANVWFPASNTGIAVTRDEALDGSNTFTVWIAAAGKIADVAKFATEKGAREYANRAWSYHQTEGTLDVGIYNLRREITADGIAGTLTNWRPVSFM